MRRVQMASARRLSALFPREQRGDETGEEDRRSHRNPRDPDRRGTEPPAHELVKARHDSLLPEEQRAAVSDGRL